MRAEDLMHRLERRAQRGEPTRPEERVAAARELAERRRRTQMLGTGAVAALVVLVAAAVVWSASPWSEEPVSVVSPPDTLDGPSLDQDPLDWIEGLELQPMVAHDGVGLQVPQGWNTSDENLTPAARDRTAIASFGTASIEVGGGQTCPELPIASVEQMGDDDVLGVLYERADHSDASGEPWPRRPRTRPLWDPHDHAPTAADCPDWPEEVRHWSFSFRDAGGSFAFLVAAGPSVSEDRLRATSLVVNLTFIGTPVTVDGRDYLVSAELRDQLRQDSPRIDLMVLAIGHPRRQIGIGSSTDSFGTASSSHGLSIGIAPPGTASVEVTVVGGDAGPRTHRTEALTVDAAPEVPLWIVYDAEMDRSDLDPGDLDAGDAASASARYFDAAGDEIEPNG